jgi:Bacterial cadherin-like domain/Bacterial Ig domain
MRRAATLLCLTLSLLAGVPSQSIEKETRDRVRETEVEKKAKPVPAAGNPRRRSVRKTSPLGPTARADGYSVTRGTTLTVPIEGGVLSNDTEPQSKPLTAILVTTTTHGTLTLNANGSFTYVNDGVAVPSDSFTYKASNGTVETNVATVTILITLPAPVAAGDIYSWVQNSTLTVAAPGIFANDTLNEATLRSYGIAGTEQTTIGANTPTAQGGTIRIDANGGFTYVPANGFNGTDTFHYVVQNSGGGASVTVTITVAPPPAVVVNDSYNAAQGTALEIEAPGVLGNDTLNGAAISGYGATTGTEQTTIGGIAETLSNGSVRLNANGSFRYTPASSFTGTDRFRYTLTNGGGSVTATVTITVTASDQVDFVVTSPGFFFAFSGVPGNNPTLNLQRGRTYRFRVDTSPIHPFEIINVPDGSVINNGISEGILIFDVPAGPGTYEYHCTIHDFGGQIQTTP